MRLSATDKKMLSEMGISESDWEQIKNVSVKTKYLLITSNGEKRLLLKELDKYISRKEVLNGLARSAFHCTAVRDCDIIADGSYIFIDSSEFFKSK